MLNDVAEKVTGWSIKKLMKTLRGCIYIIHEQDRAVIKDLIEEVILTDAIQGMESMFW